VPTDTASPSGPPRAIKTRLSAMMFLQYFGLGTFLPILSYYLLGVLHFDASQVGWVMAMQGVSAIIAPFFITAVADRVISAERLLALCHLGAGCAMLVLSRQTEFWPVLFSYLAFGMLFMPTFALTNAVTFHHVADPKRDFGIIRMWGPISWVVVGWGFGYLWLRGGSTEVEGGRLPHALILCAATCFVLAAYCMTLPTSTTASSGTSKKVSVWKSLGIFTRPSIAVLCLFTLVNSVIHQFYYYGMSPFLSQIGFKQEFIMPAMSCGQLGEVFMLATLGWFLPRLGVKRALIIGVLAQVARSLAYATGNPWLTVALIPSHGLCYAYFFTVAYIYIDTHSGPHERAGAQQLFNILIAGLGNLFGHSLAGLTAYHLTRADGINFRAFWLISAAAAAVVAVAMGVLFREENPVAEEG
jgi:nucleoside transporter